VRDRPAGGGLVLMTCRHEWYGSSSCGMAALTGRQARRAPLLVGRWVLECAHLVVDDELHQVVQSVGLGARYVLRGLAKL